MHICVSVSVFKKEKIYSQRESEREGGGERERERERVKEKDFMFDEVSQVASSAQMVYEEKYLKSRNYAPLQVVGTEGFLFNAVLLSSFRFLST